MLKKSYYNLVKQLASTNASNNIAITCSQTSNPRKLKGHYSSNPFSNTSH